MKKKFVSILAAALLVFGLAGQALAYFEDAHLIRVVYNGAGNIEVATDLGSISSLLTYTGSPVTVGGAADEKFELSQFGTGVQWTSLNVAYYSAKIDTIDAWMSATPGSNAQRAGAGSWGSFSGGFQMTGGLYNAEGTERVIINKDDETSANAYQNVMNQYGLGVGTFNGSLYANNFGEGSLASFADAGSQSISQKLFFHDTLNTSGVKNGVFKALITTNEDGSTTINAVPVPASLLLLGSGLLGLIGIRRKKA